MTSAGWITLYGEVKLLHGWQQILYTMELLALKATMFLNQVLLLWHIPDTNTSVLAGCSGSKSNSITILVITFQKKHLRIFQRIFGELRERWHMSGQMS